MITQKIIFKSEPKLCMKYHRLDHGVDNCTEKNEVQRRRSKSRAKEGDHGAINGQKVLLEQTAVRREQNALQVSQEFSRPRSSPRRSWSIENKIHSKFLKKFSRPWSSPRRPWSVESRILLNSRENPKHTELSLTKAIVVQNKGKEIGEVSHDPQVNYSSSELHRK